MNDQPDRLRHVLEAIDAANAKDPHLVEEEGRQVPAEWLYGQRMGATLADLVPEASEALTIAARGQHIERWTSLRTAYPAGRMGYLRWRTDLKAYHAQRLAELMAEHGFDQETIDRVGALVRKERLKQDAEVQALEDVVCVVFLMHYLADFAAKHNDNKVADILAKTWRKMSSRGHAAARSLGLPEHVLVLLQAGLTRLDEVLQVS
jgi:uncharacterized protein DUF4202